MQRHGGAVVGVHPPLNGWLFWPELHFNEQIYTVTQAAADHHISPATSQFCESDWLEKPLNAGLPWRWSDFPVCPSSVEQPPSLPLTEIRLLDSAEAF